MKSYGEYKNIVDDHLLDYIPKRDGYRDDLLESIKYSLTAGGKRLRPVLLLAACDMVGGDILAALPFAIAIEYIHTYSLIHDDLPAMDDDTLRRGIATNHMVYGEAIAILAGDGLLNTAFEIMAKTIEKQMDNPSNNVKGYIKAMNCVGIKSGVQGMIGGQTADIMAEKIALENIIEPQLEYIHNNKTSALIEAAILAGLYIAQGDDYVIAAMDEYGHNLGLAFQMADDILDTEGEEKLLGKNIGSDEERNKATYTAIFGIPNAKDRLRSLTENSLKALEKLDNMELDTNFFKELALDLEKRTS